MLGYKVFNSDFTCRDFKYEVGKTYTINGKIKCCQRGFHFCKGLIKCFNYYSFDYNNKFAIVEANDEIIIDDNKKYCTNNINIVRELSFGEVCEILGFSEKLGRLFIDSFNITKSYKGFWRVLLGSGWFTGTNAGSLYWALGDGSSHWARYLGARIISNRIELFEWGYSDKPFAFISEDGIKMTDDYEIGYFTEEEIKDYCNYLKEKLF